ncbi:hypothetical protein [Nostoc sp. LEGE 12450]|nr:hypothetical protein [Nostoc sp. LEGE 12450]
MVQTIQAKEITLLDFYIFNPGNELYTVLRVLKRLGKLAINAS